jgi:mono/diheme cytochrome c family protein
MTPAPGSSARLRPVLPAALVALALATIVTPALVPAAEPAPGKRSVLDGVFSKEQVSRGKKGYESLCARCHGDALGGGEDSPALVEQDFINKWAGKTIGALVEYTREEMPSDGPGDLTRKESTDITAFVLSANDYPLGASELPPDLKVLNQILITPKP